MSETIRECVRCGIRRRVKPERPGTGICRDCWLVAHDLNELERWVA